MAAETTQTYNTLLTKTINKILRKTTENYETAIRDFIELGIDINDTFYRVYELGTQERLYQRDDTFITPEYPYPSRFDYRGIPPPKFKETCILYEIIRVGNIDALRELLYGPHVSGVNSLNVNIPIHLDRYNVYTPHAKYETPLYVACGYFNNNREGSIEIIHELLNHGACPNGHPDVKERRQYLNPMKQMLDIILRTGCNREKFAALQSMLETMIHFGGDLTFKYLYPTSDTVLHHIVRNTKLYNYDYRNMLRGHKHCENKPTQEQICGFIKMLFKYGVDVTKELPLSRTALDVCRSLVKEPGHEDYEYDYARPILELLEKEFNWKRRFKLMGPIFKRRIQVRISRLQIIRSQVDDETWKTNYESIYQHLVRTYG